MKKTASGGIAGIALCAVALAACTTLDIDLPAISEEPTGVRETGRVVWHDLLTTTPEASRRFYGELFGWTFEDPGIALGFGGSDAYRLIRHEGRLIGGMVDARTLNRDENVSQWITVISVADISAATAAVEAAGGDVLTRPISLPTRGTMGVYADSDGAIFALLEARDGDPPAREARRNDFLWDELWTRDVAGAAAFYRRVVGLGYENRDVSGAAEYHLLLRGAEPQAGIMQHPFPEARPVWANYLRVDDPGAVADRVEALGGRVAIPPQERPTGGVAALILGPSGAGIALQTWPPEED